MEELARKLAADESEKQKLQDLTYKQLLLHYLTEQFYGDHLRSGTASGSTLYNFFVFARQFHLARMVATLSEEERKEMLARGVFQGSDLSFYMSQFTVPEHSPGQQQVTVLRGRAAGATDATGVHGGVVFADCRITIVHFEDQPTAGSASRVVIVI